VRDWKAIAKASGLGIPAHDVDRIVAPLEGLDAVFRPLIRNLPPELEPAAALPEEGGE
jgi:hypothetical protein